MPYGMTPVRHAGGGTPQRLNNHLDYRIADDYDTALFRGDPVFLVTGGTIEKALSATAPALMLGVFWGVSYIPDTGAYAGRPIYDSTWPASQSIEGSFATAYVYDDPGMVYMIEADQAVTALAQTDVFSGIDFTDGTGNALTKVSGAFVDSSDTLVTDGQLRILGSAQDDRLFTAVGTAMDIYVQFNGTFFSAPVVTLT